MIAGEGEGQRGKAFHLPVDRRMIIEGTEGLERNFDDCLLLTMIAATKTIPANNIYSLSSSSSSFHHHHHHSIIIIIIIPSLSSIIRHHHYHCHYYFITVLLFILL
ncbi:unnamed protein product [Wuchereria bancrofti]|uniref:Uncharacterized protein n=1 Tax=Wuchereria bancrofti TaxID=6293 RepID=A0A3P7E6A2_WUCBA|nr:unnamed protein product [Wuchereria bancrofti]